MSPLDETLWGISRPNHEKRALTFMVAGSNKLRAMVKERKLYRFVPTQLAKFTPDERQKIQFDSVNRTIVLFNIYSFYIYWLDFAQGELNLELIKDNHRGVLIDEQTFQVDSSTEVIPLGTIAYRRQLSYEFI
ncbi:hypothetical protein HYW54_03285 [Candidatus Gottesmanbacteria bacterium]|nr:hypothetical protein [Candidatus Gottesmanbacteria bacterium]